LAADFIENVNRQVDIDNMSYARKSRVVLSDVLGGKDVVEGRDGRTDGRTCRIVIGRIRVKTDLPPQIRFYILPLVNTVG
jgi:hypothetical protein